jgi:hypothetical protein
MFYTSHNNGVYAIVPKDVLINIFRVGRIVRRLRKIKGDDSFDFWKMFAHISRTPIFTFTREERVKESPWFTGDETVYRALVDYLIPETGGEARPSGFFVPFSNGMEIGAHGAEAQQEELLYVTSEQQFQEAFGVSSEEVLNICPPDEA